MAGNLADLLGDIQREARRADYPVDREVYQRAGKDPLDPILFAGSLDAPVCVFGRDLGKDEVKHGQPLVGAGGRLVRQGILRKVEPGSGPPTQDREVLENALGHALLTNTVPYKPPGNRAYAESVKERFRPFVLRLLTDFWKGGYIITLGTVAFQWFERYGFEKEFRSVGRTDERFDLAFSCRLPARQTREAPAVVKEVQVLPLPHPSPLNRRWHGRFPSLLNHRLSQVRD